VIAMAAAILSAAAAASSTPEPVTFPTSDGGVLVGDLYGTGERGLVLAHGGRFDKESWAKQAKAFAASGFRVLAFDFRGYGKSRGPGQADPVSAPLERDVLAAVRYLHENGAKTVSVVGASMGGDAAEGALGEAKPGEIDRVVLLAHGAYGPPERLKGRKLFIVSRDDLGSGDKPRLDKIRAQYQKAADPKSW